MHALATWVTRSVRHRALRALVLALAAAAPWAPACAFDWQVDVTPAGELFPGLDLSQAPNTGRTGIGGGNGLVTVRLHGADLPHEVRVRIDTRGLRRAAVVAASRGNDARTTLDLQPRFDWDIAQLRALQHVRRQVLRVTLDADGTRAVRDVDVRVHPLDDALYYVREGRDRVDLGWAFAGYVNPRDPVVDEVLALARGIDARIDAAGSGPEDDLHRVAAIWAALERRGLRYADGDPALSRGPAVWSQRVRLPGDVWRDRRANCLDSSVLIASVLERIGLHAFIALVPGHAFVGFRSGRGDADTVYLETTLLGARGSAAANFAAARAAGRARWRKSAARLDGRHGPDYALVDIGTARAYGIIPLGAAERAGQNPTEVDPMSVGPSRKRGSP